MDISKLSAGKNPPHEINVVIEIPQGSSVKYELDKESGCMFVDRFVPGAMFYPCNYGFIPQTHADDGDALDVLVLSSQEVAPGTVIKARPIGMLEMEDEAGIDTKIIAVPLAKVDQMYKDIESVDQLPALVTTRIKNFFDRYKDLEEGKWVKTKDFLPKEDAEKAIMASMEK